MRIARTLPHNADLPDRDLAVFLAGTPEMDAYRRDLFWAQEYAPRNRAVMLALVMQAVRGVVRAGRRRFEQPISLPPQLRGRGDASTALDLLVTRKGAIRAGRGRPRASSRARWAPASYIVRGLGNPERRSTRPRTAPAGG